MHHPVPEDSKPTDWAALAEEYRAENHDLRETLKQIVISGIERRMGDLNVVTLARRALSR